MFEGTTVPDWRLIALNLQWQDGTFKYADRHVDRTKTKKKVHVDHMMHMIIMPHAPGSHDHHAP
jgi:hypothetical protein